VQGEDTNTGVFFPAADTVAVATGGFERMRVDSSGNVGVGVTPSAWGGGLSVIDLSTRGSVVGSSGGVNIVSNAYYNGSSWIYKGSTYASYMEQNVGNAGAFGWFTAPQGTAGNAITFTQAMTLDASGNLLVGTTSNGATTHRIYASASNHVLGLNSESATGEVARLYSNGTAVGTISVTASATAYNTSSDYRLKENVQPMQDALAKIAQLNPVTYTWKADGSDGQGFIAHELQAVVPDCVTGEKDAVDAEGNPQYQGVDTSFLVATLVKAVQELTARIAALEAAQ
jgi:hypothetical protein